MNQKDNKPFQWTDELVKKFANELFIDVTASDKVISDFKASHGSSEKVDWEIVRMKSEVDCKFPTVYFDLQPNGKFVSEEWPNEEFDLKEDFLDNKIGKKYSIVSVRRLSDNTVWTIGDALEKFGIIIKFKIQCNKWVVAHTDSKNGVFIEDFKKAPKPEEKPSVKPPVGIMPELLYRSERFNHLSEAIDNYEKANKNVPSEWRSELKELNSWLDDYHSKKMAQEKPVLFTTEDGVPVYDIDQHLFWVLTTGDWKTERSMLPANVNNFNKTWKAFSTDAARKEYILINKPCFSVNDLKKNDFGCTAKINSHSDSMYRNRSEFYILEKERLKQLASSKIKGGEDI